MLGNFLIAYHLIHPGYAGFQLKRGYSTLRLTSEEKYKPIIPTVIKIID